MKFLTPSCFAKRVCQVQQNLSVALSSHFTGLHKTCFARRLVAQFFLTPHGCRKTQGPLLNKGLSFFAPQRRAPLFNQDSKATNHAKHKEATAASTTQSQHAYTTSKTITKQTAGIRIYIYIHIQKPYIDIRLVCLFVASLRFVYDRR